MRSPFFAIFSVACAGFFYGGITTVAMQPPVLPTVSVVAASVMVESLPLVSQIELVEQVAIATNEPSVVLETRVVNVVPEVPFYSQFVDISATAWQKVGCGIASVGMLIDYYSEETVSVDKLLERGVKNGSFLPDAGWIHAGLIALARGYGLDGESVSLVDEMPDTAFAKMMTVLTSGPVMASVHYTFEPTNPIPHLVVVTGVHDGKVFYNDPAEEHGGGSILIARFQKAWKQRYIVIRPTYS